MAEDTPTMVQLDRLFQSIAAKTGRAVRMRPAAQHARYTKIVDLKIHRMILICAHDLRREEFPGWRLLLRKTSILPAWTHRVRADRLVLTSFECVEGVSELFEYRIDALSREGNIDFDSMLGRNCTLTFNTQGGGKRFFDGILAEAHWLGPTPGSSKEEEEHAYSLVLRPWLWLLSFRYNCLIFHEKTAPKIIEEIFGKHGFADFKNNLSRDYPELEYCVQYRESDMAFVCRLMEQHGISYYFEHSDGAHKLILADEASTFKTIDGSSRRFAPGSRDFAGQKETFRSLIPRAAGSPPARSS